MMKIDRYVGSIPLAVHFMVGYHQKPVSIRLAWLG